MSTLAEIESAIIKLPRRDQRRLHTLLSKRLDARNPPRAVSLHERMKDLCGSISSGKGDLSIKKKHLRVKGYGK